MPNDTDSVLARHWAVMRALFAQITGLDLPKICRARHLQLLHLLRVTESLMRRWLVLNAGAHGGQPAVRQARPVSPYTHAGAPRASAPPRFCLVEPEPVLRAADYILVPPGAPVPDQSPFIVLNAATRLDPAHSDAAVLCIENLMRRTAALRDVLDRPAYHTARMARWLSRAAAKARLGPARRAPMRVGRPPGARRRDKNSQTQQALYWLDRLARDCLEPGWVP